jgi:hypothetical protein
VTVVEYYAAHKTATLWQAVLIGFAFVCFLWFAETLSARLSAGPGVIAAAAVTATLYLVAIGAWESLGETYGGAAVDEVSLESYGDANALYDVGIGSIHLANFAAAAFVGAAAAAFLLSAGVSDLVGRLGVGLAVVLLVNASLQIFAGSEWSDAVSAIAFFAFLGWVCAASAALVVAMRRGREPT